ncbi:tRNA (adenosine(37)-N6)-threonylcarbamoyltransferase complex dimerization subunit type 1 TsaB [Vibrio albus]|jgi:tRNA threonylcarbamoyladenosine biosynthesis protein TsaB|uniref:tRNA threonylcarbamoyladenosine biosynthesis protein TsaB n=1 Tax=Vibrio albus TaxID=2200953 RepID=A0A2U3BC43_9VIBR|nr:tRNA (adenosine(37)-N6)-threonylcarbamoyltransferase complex dimerization subunit type 1 TsaB [Vibrio albus]PWI34347.1 tRNA (adenosine(37)-N6)-threonylcarbamoyltransferase complex dimerization subunit type 1 TsaB [Vibrio albus]
MSAKILALDTATENCSVALLYDGTITTRSEISPRGHASKVLPMVDEVLKEAGLTLAELDALAFGQGPGSFTGVRIGTGIAQGLAFGADIPMIGISTLEAMAQAMYRIHGVSNAVCAIDARMSEVYWARYQRQENGVWLAVDDECVIPPQALCETVQDDEHTWSQAGTGWDAYQEELAGLALKREKSDVLFPEAQDIVVLAEQAYAEGKAVAPEEAGPVYLRDKVAWKKLPGRE